MNIDVNQSKHINMIKHHDSERIADAILMGEYSGRN